MFNESRLIYGNHVIDPTPSFNSLQQLSDELDIVRKKISTRIRNIITLKRKRDGEDNIYRIAFISEEIDVHMAMLCQRKAQYRRLQRKIREYRQAFI